MKILIVGATGATGRLLLKQLLDRGHAVHVIVRSRERLPQGLVGHDKLRITEASVLDLTSGELAEHVGECEAVASCLGHTMSLKGIYGSPTRLVTDATRRLCEAINANDGHRPTKYLLMNTTGNSNRDLEEPISFAEKCVIGLLRLLLPPHVDNESAADYLRIEVGRSTDSIEWVAVRPDSLTDAEEVTPYEVEASPTTSAIFGAGKTSRINVAHFMAELITDDDTWSAWKGAMPVLYNQDS